ncbi:MAG: dynamin family protein [Pseudomonadota bacterium]
MPQSGPGERIQDRIDRLEEHLRQEHPALVEAVTTFRELDRVAHATGMLGRDQSFTSLVTWWPVIAILGTYSAGKSTFINGYIGRNLQTTGNQAVDDRFTVICFGPNDEPVTLPGTALNADPRFPFYRTSTDLDLLSQGEGARIDAYLQLRALGCEKLRGKLLIDSPGFDADEQRTATLGIAHHIIDLADLVLVFFDARHPEPRAMQDTLQHLVTETAARADSNKFLYVLNQVDNVAREDNLEEVFAAWQRALARAGLAAGEYFQIYDTHAAITVEDEERRARFQSKAELDRHAIYRRIDRVEVDRAYRIAARLEELAQTIQNQVMPAVADARDTWRKRVLIADVALVLIGAALLWRFGTSEAIAFPPTVGQSLMIAAIVVVLFYAHTRFRRFFGRLALSRINDTLPEPIRDLGRGALGASIRLRHSVFFSGVPGWNRSTKRRIETVLRRADEFVQALNDRYADPSGPSVTAIEEEIL